MPEILVAGCGTGEQIFSTIGGYESWRITAIDISRPSLAYAKRQTGAHGLPDITYAVCDILDVSLLGKDFDIIECTGVLHHMADPLQGWRALLACLRPGGLMLVALYSTLARTDIQAARDLGFADAGAMQFPDFRSVCRRGCLAAQPSSVRPCMR